jgi:hypothetical protein
MILNVDRLTVIAATCKDRSSEDPFEEFAGFKRFLDISMF